MKDLRKGIVEGTQNWDIECGNCGREYGRWTYPRKVGQQVVRKKCERLFGDSGGKSEYEMTWGLYAGGATLLFFLHYDLPYLLRDDRLCELHQKRRS